MAKFRYFEIQASVPMTVLINLDHIVTVESSNGFAFITTVNDNTYTSTIEFEYVANELELTTL